jgi:hypothetical protein
VFNSIMELVAKSKVLQILVHLFKASLSRTDYTASNRSGLINEEREGSGQVVRI